MNWRLDFEILQGDSLLEYVEIGKMIVNSESSGLKFCCTSHVCLLGVYCFGFVLPPNSLDLACVHQLELYLGYHIHFFQSH
jgi:hypothetical protein